jgi:hypothetical protein
MSALKTVKITDGGDGSTFLKFTFEDGTEKFSNPDIPYDGHVLLTFDGTNITTTTDYGDGTVESYE